MTDIDELAQVIRNAFEKHTLSRGRGNLVPWSEISDDRKEKWREMARAAYDTISGEGEQK